MSFLPFLLHVAGGVQLCVASANLFAFDKFHYRHYLRTMPNVIQQVFMVQNGYIMFTQLGFSLLCFYHADALISPGMGHAISSWLSVFWGSRVGLQLFYYDRQLRKENAVFDKLFILGDGFLATTFALAAFSTS